MTSYSGYAYSFKDDPQKIYTNTWYASGQLTSNKTPTCILFDKDIQFSAFGYAEDKYANHCLDNNQDEWYFFKEYKMALYEQLRVSKDIKIGDAQGRQFPLFTLVTETIRYLKSHLMESCMGNISGLLDTDIQWVLTVPAIWSDSAKNFMRQAAENAGIPGYRLNICLEPEAAAIYCKTVPSKISSEDSAAKLACFKEGDSYLLFDAGGGTIDIIAHQVGKDGELEEIHPACGGNWGGAMVDEAFMEFLTNLAGTEALKEFCSAEIYDFHDLMRDFESKKKSSGRQSDSAKVCIRIPCSLQNDINRRKADAMQGDEVRIERDKLILSLGKMHDFFNCSKEAVRKYLKGLFSLKSLQGVNNILMVGGYSESAILQQFIKESFKDKSVITPASPGLAVLKGAVLYGHDPSVIAERRCRFTYGTVCNKIFNESKHKESVKFTDDSGKIRAGDCFGIHVAVGRAVKIGTFQPEQSYTPGRKYQDMMHFPLYVCPRESPVYVTEDDCVEIGNLSIDISDLTGTEKDKKVRMALCLSGTEITIKAKKKQTGDILTATIKYDH